MDNLDDQQLHDQINLGVNIKDLAQHKGFDELMSRLKIRRDQAVLKYIELDPIEENLPEMKKLHLAIWKHDELASEMYTLISMGMDAMTELRQGGTIEEAE